MTETRQDFEIWTGDTISIEDDVSGGDITNHDIRFDLYNHKGGESVLTKTDDDAGTRVVDASTLSVQLDGSDTESLDFFGDETYYYRIIVTDAQGQDMTVTTGTITVHD